ncbi:hypothetical protein LQ944_05465 [Staphylococcus pasteuri]|uniref:immunodominant staphylococcal antigen IsaB family protein n=1 Tax=Staphylococcus TaxID=1279 RepID=UPI0002F2C11B|nr:MULTISPECIES: hypothetical protein [Staphylococcus]ODB43087.1 hypothetical protein A9N02_10820 [Staphylococcus sp. AOAB]MBL3398831.1 hypothetical protein [Staphylococcus pasteuri]MCO0861558.1 hypothetical protein [Staphylococcus pasteuri]MCO5360001.1 hypothetical protein [Staphylococcus pasteuri]MEB7434544.1 hypothetical protein [Staphylococcus pasteuri]
MKKLTKTFVASSIILGTALGVSVSADNVSSHEAHAASSQYWYKYNGYTASGGNFVLSSSFYNGLKAGNVEFNGVKVNSKYQAPNNSKDIYDQNFQQYKNHKANNVEFKIKPNTITLKQVKQKYGNHYDFQNPLNGPTKKKGDGLYSYQVGKGHIVFVVQNGYVTYANVS